MQTSVRIFVAVVLAMLTFSMVAADAPKTFTVSEFNFTQPTGWEWVEVTSSMRKAQLKVPSADKKESAEVVFFYFGPGNGGGTQANVDRWIGQFGEDKSKPKVEDRTIKGHRVTYVEVEGTYMSGMPGGARTPQPKSMLEGAIIESKDGNVFVKMTGPAAIVKGAKDAFRKMVEGPLK